MYRDPAHLSRCRPLLAVLGGLVTLACSEPRPTGGSADRQVVRDGPWRVVCVKEDEVVFEHDDIYRVLRVDGTAPGIAGYETGDGITFRGRMGEAVNCIWERLAPPPAEAIATEVVENRAPMATESVAAVPEEAGDAGGPDIEPDRPPEDTTASPAASVAASSAGDLSVSVATAPADANAVAAEAVQEPVPVLDLPPPAMSSEDDATSLAPQTLTVEASDHGDFARLLLRADDGVGFSVVSAGETVEIRTDRSLPVDASSTVAPLAGYVSIVRTLPRDVGLMLVLRRPMQVDHYPVDGGLTVELRPYAKVQPDSAGTPLSGSPAPDLPLDLAPPPADVE